MSGKRKSTPGRRQRRQEGRPKKKRLNEPDLSSPWGKGTIKKLGLAPSQGERRARVEEAAGKKSAAWASGDVGIANRLPWSTVHQKTHPNRTHQSGSESAC